MSKFEITKEDKDALTLIGDAVYAALIIENNWTEEELHSAIKENRLSITDVQFHDQEDGTTKMSFKADIEERKECQ